MEKYYAVSKDARDTINAWKLDKNYFSNPQGRFKLYQNPKWYRTQLRTMSIQLQTSLQSLQLQFSLYYRYLTDLKNNLNLARQFENYEEVKMYDNLIKDFLTTCI